MSVTAIRESKIRPAGQVLHWPTRPQHSGIHLLLILLDRGTLTAGVLLGVVQARLLPAQQFRSFFVVAAIILFLCGFYNMLILKPMSVLANSDYAGHLAVTLLLAGPLFLTAGVMALFQVGSPLIESLLAGGVALLFLLLPWLARRMSYLLERPCMALAGSAANLLLGAIGLWILQARHKASPPLIFLLLGSCGLCVALIVFQRLKIGLDDSKPCSVRWEDAFVENIRYCQWQADRRKHRIPVHGRAGPGDGAGRPQIDGAGALEPCRERARRNADGGKLTVRTNNVMMTEAEANKRPRWPLGDLWF